MSEREIVVSIDALFTWLDGYEKKAAKLKGRYFPGQVVSWLKNDLRNAIASETELNKNGGKDNDN